jgi:hypothetical protein
VPEKCRKEDWPGLPFQSLVIACIKIFTSVTGFSSPSYSWAQVMGLIAIEADGKTWQIRTRKTARKARGRP